MTSEWSQWIFRGAEIARLTSGMTIGNRRPGVAATISHMSASPCDDVADMARAPAASAPTVADMAECSDSTGTISVSTIPLATYLANCSTIGVWGVIG